MDWIKINTPENAAFLNWFGYGHAIVGYAERESVSKNPSEESAAVVLTDDARQRVRDFDPHEKIVEIAKIYTVTNESLANSIMNKYGAKYLFITSEEESDGGYWNFYFAGLDSTQYFSLNPSSLNISDSGRMLTFENYDYSELGKQTMIYRLLSNSNLQVFNQVYSDENVKIFQIST